MVEIITIISCLALIGIAGTIGSYLDAMDVKEDDTEI